MTQSVMEAVRAVTAMSVVAMLSEFLAPEGNLQETVRTVIGLVFLLTVAQPILAVFL